MKPVVSANKTRLQQSVEWVLEYRFELFLLCFALVLWWPYADGRSSYAYSELLRDLVVTRDLAAGRVVLLGPVSSLGNFHFGPDYYYLLLPVAMLLGFARYSLAVTSMLFSLATVFLVGKLCLDWFHSRRLAQAVMALMVLSNIDLQLAKYASNPNFVPFFSVVFFMALERLMSGSRRARHWTVLGVSLGVLLQLHVVPMIAFPLVCMVAWAMGWLRVTFRGFAWSAGSALAVLSPYLWHELSHGFSNLAALFAITHQPFDLFGYATHFLDYLTFWLSPLLSLHGFFNVFGYWGSALLYGAALLAVGFFVAFRTDLRSERKRTVPDLLRRSVKRALALWLIVPSVVLLAPIPGTRVLHIYYFLALLPLAFIAYGWLSHRLWMNGWRRVAVFSACAFLAVQAAQFVLYLQAVGGLRLPVLG